VVLGLAQGKPVIGLPGYPVSTVLTAELFLKPLLERMLGLVLEKMPVVRASITRKVQSPLGEDEFLRVKLGRVGEKLVATPVQRGAGVISSLVRADGLVLIRRFSEGLDAGTEVEVELLRSLQAVENTIVAIGSHDLTLDLMASYLRRVGQPVTGQSTFPLLTSAAWAVSLPCAGVRPTSRGLICWTRIPVNITFLTSALPSGHAGGGSNPGGTGTGPDRCTRQPQGGPVS
jgi:hypothetical protein